MFFVESYLVLFRCFRIVEVRMSDGEMDVVLFIFLFFYWSVLFLICWIIGDLRSVFWIYVGLL